MAATRLTEAQRAFLARHAGFSPRSSSAAKADGPGYDTAALDRARKAEAALGGLGARAAPLLEDETRRLATQMAEVRRHLANGDDAAVARELRTATEIVREAEALLPKVRTYLQAAEGFARRLAEARKLRGAGGMIDDYVDRMEADDAARRTAEARGDLQTARAAVETEEARHGAMLREAKQAHAFQALATAMEGDMSRLTGEGAPAGGLDAALDEARRQLSACRARGDGGNWAGALAGLKSAHAALLAAEKAARAASRIQAKDLDAAEARNRKLLAALRRRPGAGLLEADLQTAETQLDAAADARADPATATARMQMATLLCLALGGRVAEAGRAQAAVKTALASRAAVAKRNLDGCIGAEMAQADRHLRAAAKNLREAAFAAALADAAAARRVLSGAETAAQVFAGSVRPARLRIVKRIKAGADDPAALKSAFESLTRAFTARDLRQAVRLARQAEALSGP